MHSADSSHNCVHTDRLGTKPGELVKYPLVCVTHARFGAEAVVLGVVVVVVGAVLVDVDVEVVLVVVGADVIVVVTGEAVVVGGACRLRNETALAEDFLVFVHAVLT